MTEPYKMQPSTYKTEYLALDELLHNRYYSEVQDISRGETEDTNKFKVTSTSVLFEILKKTKWK